VGVGRAAVEGLELRSVLVTGATGLVGSHLVPALRVDGAEVAAFGGDISDAAEVRRAVAGADTVFHLAARTIVGEANGSPLPTFETNVRGTWNVLEACRLEGIARVVVASSDKVYGPCANGAGFTEDAPLAPRFAYDASKAAADLLARSYWHTFGVPVATTRFANIYGGGDRNESRLVPELVAAVAAGRRPVIRSDGSPEREYLYVDDAVAAYLAIARALDDGVARGEAYNAGGGRAVSVRELAETLLRVAGSDLDPDFRGDGTPAGELDLQCVDASKLRAHTGWAPRVDLEEGLRRTLAWHRTAAGAR
jgi:CDP-glucose 4,6-dehydratase